MPLKMPKFQSEGEEADWWASRAGREYVKWKSAAAQSEGNKVRGSSLVGKMNRKSGAKPGEVDARYPAVTMPRHSPSPIRRKPGASQ